MNFRPFVAGACALLFATSVHAGQEEHTRIKIAIDDDTSGETSFLFDSQDAGFDLQSMLVGETRSITDSSGRTADLRRTEDGFEIDVGGKTIELPDLHGHGGMHGEHEVEMLVDVNDTGDMKDVKKVRIIKSGDAEGITIISGNTIDTATRERIAEAFEASGLNGEVHYIDGSEFHDGEHQVSGKREVRIIQKEVDVTN